MPNKISKRFSKLETPQLEYINSRNKTYRQKYSMLEYLIPKYLKNGDNILELFGGIGITSYFIKKHIKTNLHTILEINSNCIERLKINIQEADIRQIDAFKFTDYDKYDFIFIDAAEFSQTKAEIIFKPILEKLSKCKASVIITDLGFWKFSFVKKDLWIEKVPKYFEEYKKLFIKYNLHLNEVLHAHDFALLVLTREKQDIKISRWMDETTEWEKLLNPETGGFF